MDIPVHGQGERFIDPVSKIIKDHSRKVACLEAFPIRLETSEGWVKITPKITAKPPPRHQESTGGVRHHVDSGTGLYTPSELGGLESFAQISRPGRVDDGDNHGRDLCID